MRRLPFLIFLPFFLLVACQQQGFFGPIRPTPTPGNQMILGEPILLSFDQLAQNLERYQNTLVRITGVYTPLAAAPCFPPRGPQPQWSLVADSKQMRVLNFEQVVVPLAWEGLTMTLDGVWRKYEGPLGCGKNAASGISWYLEAIRIIEPNPIPDFFLENNPNLTPVVPQGTPPSGEAPLPGETPLPSGTETPTEPGLPTPDTFPTSSPTLSVTPSPTQTRLVPPTPAASTTTTTTPTASSTPTPTLSGTPNGSTPTPTLPAGTGNPLPLHRLPPPAMVIHLNPLPKLHPIHDFFSTCCNPTGVFTRTGLVVCFFW
ncbi:MAG: hypothetical protein V9G20_10090 [Candidatus Promineifilaceae bacterium]